MKRPSTKPKASLALDLDNQWSYMKTHGDSGWETFPSYLDVAVPRFLSLFEKLGVKVTVFVVGQDAALEKNQSALKSIALAGHEIGNHSFAHDPWLHLYKDHEIENEIIKAEEAIRRSIGVKPVGFRGPGYSLSKQVLKVLLKRGYLFDASTLPSFLGPLGRAYYFMTSHLNWQERQQRNKLFGSVRDGLRPIVPYLWTIDGSTMLEIPVTTVPFLRFPFHISYLIYLSKFSYSLARAYFLTALRLCRVAGIEPSMLVHPLDLLGIDDISTLGFFPGMDLESDEKLERVERFLSDLLANFDVLPLGEYAKYVHGHRMLPTRAPDV